MKIIVLNSEKSELVVRESNSYEKSEYDKLQEENSSNQNIISGIKQEAFRRIREIMPQWMVEREITGGTPISQEIKDRVAALRDISDRLESELIEDYYNDIHWQ